MREDESQQKNVGSKLMRITTKAKMSIRNLRIREDLPKYLRNLNPNSAYYDAKTRSMRANPTPGVPADQLTYHGDNAMRMTGDTKDFMKTQVFAWCVRRTNAVAKRRGPWGRSGLLCSTPSASIDARSALAT